MLTSAAEKRCSNQPHYLTAAAVSPPGHGVIMNERIPSCRRLVLVNREAESPPPPLISAEVVKVGAYVSGARGATQTPG